MQSLITLLTYIVGVCLIISTCSCRDPDENLDTASYITSRGYGAESHYVLTEDGYFLCIHRIVNPKIGKNVTLKPVFMQHGLESSSIDFINNAPGAGMLDYELNDIISSSNTAGNNLGFVLADFGYDVWLGNSRGNAYSTNHTKLDPNKDKEFWLFSFDQMIEYDLPNSLNYVLKQTNQTTLAYIGYSQGTLLMFGLLAAHPEWEQKIKPYIALAPVAFARHIKSPFKMFAKCKLFIEILKHKGGRFIPSLKLIRYIDEHMCETKFKELCAKIIFFFTGYDVSNFNITRLPVYLSNIPSGTSSWNIAHWSQNVYSGQFSKFDFGRKENMKVYGTPKPPRYPLDAINSTNIIIYRSNDDWLSDSKDVDILLKSLKVPLLEDHIVTRKNFTHLDFIWAEDTGALINQQVIQDLQKHA